MMNRVVGKKTGTVYDLDPRALIGQGTEGRVYRSRGNKRCVKVFEVPLCDEQAEKIGALVGLGKKIPGFAWPLEIVTDEISDREVGFAMEFFEGDSLENLMNARETANIPILAKMDLALQAAKSVAIAHASRGPKIVLGDVLKAANLVVRDNQPLAVFVDAATVSAFGFRVPSGDVRTSTSTLTTPGYVPREVLENPMAVPSRSADLFALGVVLFELFYGRPPHEPKPCPAAVGLEPDDAVRRGIFPRWSRHPQFEAPTYDPIDLPDEVDDLFRGTFLSSGIRPPASLWCTVLERHLTELTPVPPEPPDPVPSSPSRLIARNWIVAERLLAVAISAWLLARGFAWAAESVARSPDPVELPSPPPTPVGPPLFRELFR